MSTIKQVFPSGRYIDLARINVAEDVEIRDIARALALTNRFGGGTLFPYSVAAHSLAAREIMDRAGFNYQMQMAALLHDAEEAYFGGIPAPMKGMLPVTLRADMRNLRLSIIRHSIGDYPIEEFAFTLGRVKEIDNWLLYAERRVLLPSTEPANPYGWPNEDQQPPPWIAEALGVLPWPLTHADIPAAPPVSERSWRGVEKEFLLRYEELHREIAEERRL